MPMDVDNLLWRRVAALRELQIPSRGEHAPISGARFQVQIAAGAGRKTAARVSDLLSDSTYSGVIGEIVVPRDGAPRRKRVHTSRGLGTHALDWQRALIEREAERLARLQPEHSPPADIDRQFTE